MNLWIGASAAGSSSGLHHDYHDNLYFLLQGRKRFRLFCPSEAPRLYTVGRLVRIHANGRVNYEGFPTRADGSDLDAERAREASARLAQAEDEDEEERALCEVLDIECAGQEEADYSDDEDDDEDRDDEDQDDAAADAEDAEDAHVSSVEDEEAAEERDGCHGSGAESSATGIVCRGGAEGSDRGLANQSPTSSIRVHGGTSVAPSRPAFAHVAEKAASSGAAQQSALPADGAAPLRPANFSRIDLDEATKVLEVKFPAFRQAPAPVTCELRAGQVLFLPAGWFHEVTSFSELGGSDAASSHLLPNAHVALNYWFHPPDSNNFDTPYSSCFWPLEWASQAAAFRRGGEETAHRAA